MTMAINPTSVVSLPLMGKGAARIAALETFYEDWRDNFLDRAKWLPTIGTGGTVTVDLSNPGATGFPGGCRLDTGTDAAGNAYLTTQLGIFPVQHGQAASKAIVHRSCVEWEMRFGTITAFDNAAFFIGLITAATADRTGQNIMGCGLSSDALILVSDNGGTETTQATTNVLTLTNTMHKCRLTLDRVDGLRLFVADALEATITTNIPNAYFAVDRFIISVHNDSAASAVIDIGKVRAWVEDIV